MQVACFISSFSPVLWSHSQLNFLLTMNSNLHDASTPMFYISFAHLVRNSLAQIWGWMGGWKLKYFTRIELFLLKHLKGCLKYQRNLLFNLLSMRVMKIHNVQVRFLYRIAKIYKEGTANFNAVLYRIKSDMNKIWNKF